jgi:hypothetical protein
VLCARRNDGAADDRHVPDQSPRPRTRRRSPVRPSWYRSRSGQRPRASRRRGSEQ